MYSTTTTSARGRIAAILAALVAFFAITTAAEARPVKVHDSHANAVQAAKAAGLSRAQTRAFLSPSNSAKANASRQRVALIGLDRLSAHDGARAAYSAGYPFPDLEGITWAASAGGTPLGGQVGCYQVEGGGATDSYFEKVKNQLLFVAAYRGYHVGTTGTYTAQRIGGNTDGGYGQDCLIYFRYPNGFGVTERTTHSGHVWGHGGAVTGWYYQVRSGIVPFYGSGDSRNGAPQYVCNSGAFSPTEAGCN